MSSAADAFLAEVDARLTLLQGALARASTPREAAWDVCGFTARELRLTDVVLYLVDADGRLVQQAAWGPKRAAAQILESRIVLEIGRGIVGTCAAERAPVRVIDTRRDPRYICDEESNRSELAVPICLDGRLVGVLDSEHRHPGHYDAGHERALQAIADRAAPWLAPSDG
jgi:putative methionine-R-sulfoxide reductase with GAF domain